MGTSYERSYKLLFHQKRGEIMEMLFVRVDKTEDLWLVGHAEVLGDGNVQYMREFFERDFQEVDSLVGSPLLNIVDQILEGLKNGSVV